MITIKLTDNVAEVTRGLDEQARRQLPFATALALTRTARAVERSLQTELQNVFDQPTPFILRGTFATSATKRELTATVGMRDQARNGRAGPAMYVKESFAGGARGMKPFEMALRRIGALPDGWRAVPGAALKTDRYGNPDRKTLTEIIGALASGSNVWAGRGKRQALIGYFVVKPGAGGRAAHFTQPGIFRRVQRGSERAVQSLLVFQSAARYRQRIDLRVLAERVVAQDFAATLRAALAQAQKGQA